jgi:hypothetical protein
MAKPADGSAPAIPDPVIRPAYPVVDSGSGSIDRPRLAGPITRDWRTIDASTIQGDGIPVEELRFYRETIDEMLRVAAGSYVLIVGREVISYFPDLELAANQADRDFRGQTFLIKKVAPIEPVHTTGGVVA